MAKIKALPVAAAVAAAIAATSVSAVEFHGYFRAGFGLNADGGSQVCYGNGGPPSHKVGRLGDECDTYAELSFSQNVYEKNGESFSVHTLMAMGTPGNTNRDSNVNYRGNSWQGVSDENGDPWTGQRFSFREAYAKYKTKGGTELWAGNRFYGRKDVHIWDMYYVNGSGYGAGVDFQAGPGRLAIAVRETKWHSIQKDADGNPVDGNNPYTSTPQLDLRYNGIQLGGAGNLDLILMVGKANPSDAEKAGLSTNQGNDIYADYNNKTGISATAELSTPVLSGFNKLVLQYSTEGYGWTGFGFNNHLGDAVNVSGGGDTGRKSFRLIDHGVIKLSKQFVLGYAGMYSQMTQHDYDWADGNKAEAYGITIRPQYMWNDTMSTILEAGWMTESYPWAKKKQDLSKVTIAQAWSPLMNGGFWARPQIRVFATFYSGDQAQDKAKNMFGAQVEAWW